MKRFIQRFAFSSCVFFAAAAQAAPFAYVTDVGYGRISVFDTATHKRQAAIPIPNYDLDMLALSPDGRHAYVTNNNIDGGVHVVDTLTMQITDLVSVSPGPGVIAMSPNGAFAYTLHSYQATVTAIATATNMATAIPVGQSPCDIAFTPDSTRAYVSNSTDGTVSVINTTTNMVIKTILISSQFADDPCGLAATPDGSQVYVAHSKNISIIDTASNTIVGSPIAVSNYPVFLKASPDGSRIYALGNASPNSIAVISRATNTVALSIPVNDNATRFELTADGSLIYVVNAFDNTLTTIKTSDYSASTISGLCFPQDVKFGGVASQDQLFTDSFDTCS
jgi:YVTN family beta-propeller protein